MEEIYADITKGVRKPKNKLAMFLCGAAGTGKTWNQPKILQVANITTTFVTLNIDDIRPIIGTQEAARKIFNQLFNKTLEDGYSLLYDGTCRDKGNTVHRMKKLKAAGYKIIVGVMYAPLDLVLRRIRRRTRQPLEEDVARDIYAHLKKNIEIYMSIDDIDEIYLYNSEHAAKLLYSRKGDEVNCVDPKSDFYFDISKYC
jgi:predicted ABC-type ATPase